LLNEKKREVLLLNEKRKRRVALTRDEAVEILNKAGKVVARIKTLTYVEVSEQHTELHRAVSYFVRFPAEVDVGKKAKSLKSRFKDELVRRKPLQLTNEISELLPTSVATEQRRVA
jgi:hypothetical protein